MADSNDKKQLLWSDKKRGPFGLPISFTRYTLTAEKLTVERGIFVRKTDEVRLYRIRDVTLIRNLRERALGLGSIEVASTDHSMGVFKIERVPYSRRLHALLSDLVEESRDRHNVTINETNSSKA